MVLDVTLMGKQLLCYGVVAFLLTAQDKAHCSTHSTTPKQCPVVSQHRITAGTVELFLMQKHGEVCKVFVK